MKALSAAVFLALAGLAMGYKEGCPSPLSLQRNCVCAALYKQRQCQGPGKRMEIPFNASIAGLTSRWATFSSLVVAKGCTLMVFGRKKYRGERTVYRSGTYKLRKPWGASKKPVASLCCICPKY